MAGAVEYPGGLFPIETYRHRILPLRKRAEVRNRWLRERLETVLPALMAREGFDMWLVIAREYNEDPVIMTMLPEPSMSARRRTILVMHRKDDGSVERLSLDRYGFGEFYSRGWDADSGEGQFACLARIIKERNPKTIGINHSKEFAFGDGLSYNEYQELAAAIGPELMARTKSADRLAIGWLETRIQAEIDAYPALIEMGHALIATAFSSQLIHPGVTTTEDVVWWMRQTMLDMGVQAWFQPSISIQAPDQSFEKSSDVRTLILPGDLIHCDVGFGYLGLMTDQQQNIYILKPGETDAPAGLKAALEAGNRLQDIHMEEMVVGRSGNEVLSAILEQAFSEGITPSVYSHPLGYHGHGAGPTIGLWDQQKGVPGNGDYELFDKTCYSIELNVTCPVPEWNGQVVRMALEENAILENGKARWLSGRQTRLHLLG